MMWRVVCLLSVSGSVFADEGNGSSVDFWGDARLSFEHQADHPVDRLGSLHGQSIWSESRLILGARGAAGESDIWEIELEALNGYLFGETSGVGVIEDSSLLQSVRHDRSDWLQVIPRKARIAGQRAWGSFSVGVDTFGWGAGLLAHDGRTESAFGDPRRGNAVGRFLIGAPVSFLQGGSLFAAADLVVRDENAEFLLGDRAVQAVGGLRIQRSRWEAGLLGLVRYQQDRLVEGQQASDPTVSLATPVDLYTRVRLTPEGLPVQAQWTTELVRVVGRSERVANGDTAGEAGRISSVGALSTLEFEVPDWGVTADLEWLYASGDNDPYDGLSRSFSVHSDHQVGLVLFEHVLPLMTARAAERASDPDLIGVPSPSTRFTVSQGGVMGAQVVNPRLSWSVGESTELRLGYLNAQSTADFIDVYETAKNGGYSTTPGGETPSSRHLGQELDVGMDVSVQGNRLGDLAIRAEAGVLFPGAALSGVVDESVYSARLRAGVNW